MHKCTPRHSTKRRPRPKRAHRHRLGQNFRARRSEPKRQSTKIGFRATGGENQVDNSKRPLTSGECFPSLVRRDRKQKVGDLPPSTFIQLRLSRCSTGYATKSTAWLRRQGINLKTPSREGCEQLSRRGHDGQALANRHEFGVAGILASIGVG